MESSSPVHVLRWTPRSSPTKSSPPHEEANDHEEIQGSTSEGDNNGVSLGGHDVAFPFSIGFPAARDASHDEVPLWGVPDGGEPVQPEPFTKAHSNGKGMFLTWKDLRVTVPDKRNGTHAILQGLTGYAGPGQMLAIMGPSGCGKSTLLDALGGTHRIDFPFYNQPASNRCASQFAMML